MNLLKSGSFWISIASAIILILQAVFGWNVDNELVNELSSAVLGALVLFGFVKKPTITDTTNNTSTNTDIDKTEENTDKTEDDNNK